ncbi:putative metallothionein SmtA [Klebsiella pneumoniae]|nr:putative metallothionein SmtA [Klebsiella pneumoniae]
MQDRNFDDIAEKFSRNIYGTTKGQLRQAILWQDLEPLLAQLGPGPLRVLDAGGGEGQTAIKVAQLGHHVTLCDLSAEMVARARQAAADKGVIDNMHFVQCAAQDIAQHLESPVDLVLFHAVLEWGGGAPGNTAYPVVDAACWRWTVIGCSTMLTAC